MNQPQSLRRAHREPRMLPPPSEDESPRSTSRRTSISPVGIHRSPSIDNQFLLPDSTARLVIGRDEDDRQSFSEQPLLSTPSPLVHQGETSRPSVTQDGRWGRVPVDEYFSGSNVSENDLSHREESDIPETLSPKVAGSFRPILPPQGYHPLDFRPTLLRAKWMTLLMFLYLAISGGIAALSYSSGSDDRFIVSSENVRLVARYCPGLTATITVLLFRQTNRDTIRMLQYFTMADQKGKITAGAAPKDCIAGAYFPWWDLGLTPFSWLLLFLQVSNLFVSALVAFKTALIGTKQIGSNWVLTVRPAPAHYLVGGYILMAFVNLIVMTWTWSRSAGLQFDPVSMADYIALFARCNALECFGGLEYDSDGHSSWTAGKRRAAIRMEKDLKFRIGYWESITRTLGGSLRSRVVYGIGVLNGGIASITASETQRFQATHVQPTTDTLDSPAILNSDLPDSEAREPATKASRRPQRPQTTPRLQEQIQGHTDWYDDRGSRLCTCQSYMSCVHYPYQVSTGLGHIAVSFWLIVVIVALAACVYAMISGAITGGFSVANTWFHVPTSTGHKGNTTVTPQDYYVDGNVFWYVVVFRAVPTQVAGYFCITYFPSIDINMRFMQPYMGMLDSPGTAAQSISLAYLTASSLKVPLDALDNGHWKVAWFATLNTLSPALPIIVASLFTIQATDARVYVTMSKSAFSIIFVYLAAYAISLPLAYPRRYRLLPRQVVSLADLMGQCHQAQFLEDPIFDISYPRSSKEKMDAWILLRENKYLFGWYLGRDGERHLGFDAVDSDNEGVTGHVRWVLPNAKWVRAADKKPSWMARLFRRNATKNIKESEGYEMPHRRTRSGVDRGPQDGQEHEHFMHGARSTAVEV